MSRATTLADVAIRRSATDKATVTIGYDPEAAEYLERLKDKHLPLVWTRGDVLIRGHLMGVGAWSVRMLLKKKLARVPGGKKSEK